MRNDVVVGRRSHSVPASRWRLASALAWLMLSFAVAQPVPARGIVQDPSTPAPTSTAATPADAVAPDEATARFFNRPILTFRSTFLGRAPAVRARAAEENIARVVARRGTATVSFRDAPQGTLVMLAGEMVTIVTPADLDTLSDQTMAQARSDIARRLGEAVRAAETEQGPQQLLHGVFWSVFGTLVLLGILGVLRLLQLRARVVFERWAAERAAQTLRSPGQHAVGVLRAIGTFVLRILFWLLVLLLLEGWVWFVLDQFSYTRPWAHAISGWIVALLARWGHAAVHAVPGLIAAIVILLIARMLAGTVNLMFRGVQSGRYRLFGIDAPLADPTRKIVIAVLWLFAIAMAYPYLPGAQTDAFKGLSVLVGLMISLGASSIVGQAAGGFTILYSRTMKVGDVVRLGDTEGKVTQIGLFTTRIRTMTGVEVNFPNNVVLNRELQNFSRHPDGSGMWLETKVTIGYDTPWRQVQRLLIGAALATEGVQKDPKPYVLQTALSDFYVEYLLRARIRELMGRQQVLSVLLGRIQDAFNAEGVQIMSPNYVADPADPKLVAPGGPDGAPPASAR